MNAPTVNAAEAVLLIDQAIALAEKKRKVLLQLRDALVREHGHGEDFPRPMGVLCLEALHPGTERLPLAYCTKPYGHLGSHRWSRDDA